MSKVALAWVDPTTYDNGDPLKIVNIELFGNLSGSPQALLGNVGPGVGAFTTEDLPPGTYSFDAVVQDDSTPQRSSVISNVAVITVPAPPIPEPNPINNLTATLVPDAPVPTP